jgi:predicted nucleic acid-binding protein
VARLIPLDAGPLGMACYNPGRSVPDRCLAWLNRLEASGAIVIVPAITDYEVRRELIRIGATAQIRNLDNLRLRFGFLDITREALELAAEFWAILRQTGLPTAGDEAIDADAILAGMASTMAQPGDSVVIATTNVKHLARFSGIDARLWETIV